jgi:hypothetical protein
VVAFALVSATVQKGIFDYAGTYLVNYAGFGMLNDLRDSLYNEHEEDLMGSTPSCDFVSFVVVVN